MTPPRHLLTLWNPSYSDDALDTHLQILLEQARAARRGEVDRDDVYVWWGKIRSRNRDGRLPHHDDVVAIDQQLQEGVETHLYLTDYRSLYVAHVGEVTDEDIRRTEGELDRMPAYYEGHAVDFWFRLFDLRRIATGDTVEVIAELRKLRNTGYHDRPVSLYGGMVDLPLIVRRDNEAGWFSDTEALTDGRLWAERAAEYRSDAERMARELRDNLFGRTLWPLLQPGTRSFLSSAEAVFRAHRDDPGFDLSGAAVSYAKALETELNQMLFPAIRKTVQGKTPHEREIREEGRLIDLAGRVPHQTLGTIKHMLEHQEIVQAAAKGAFRHDKDWILTLLPRAMAPITELRNAGAHSETTTAAQLEKPRRTILGVGCEGLLEKSVRVGMRAR